MRRVIIHHFDEQGRLLGNEEHDSFAIADFVLRAKYELALIYSSEKHATYDTTDRRTGARGVASVQETIEQVV
ncbi:MAG TPA: hypothetical protein VMV27_07655 [Candidatus Binataceae bacterium]|nr:hypothetical protein [Candidatus Binataceae bacterium]